MDIDKYFKTLKKISTLFNEDSVLWKKTKTKAIYQNHWLTDSFLDLKTQLIKDVFFTEKNFTHLLSLCSQSRWQSQKIAIVIEDNIILSGIYELLVGVGVGGYIEIKCLPHHKTLLEPIVKILNKEEEQVFFVEKFSKNYSFYSLHKKGKFSATATSYFEKYPHAIHTPKKGIAIIEGNEKKEKLQLLAKHIFSFFGMDNLNISKIFLPQGYNTNLLFENFNDYCSLKNHTHYALQYDYHLAMVILQKKLYFTNGLITLVQNQETFSPLSTLNFEYYTNLPSSISLENDDVSYTIKVNGLEEDTMKKLETNNSYKIENTLLLKPL